MERYVIREKFPDPTQWVVVCIDIIQYSTYEKRVRFTSEYRCLGLHLIF